MLRAGQAPCRRRPVSSTLGLEGSNARVPRFASSLRLRSQADGGCVQRHRRSSSPSSRFDSGASRQAVPAFFVSAPQGQFVAASLTDRLTRLTGAVQAAQEGGSGAIANAVQAQLFARPNRAFNRRCHGRLPCPRGSVCISSATRARQPAASPPVTSTLGLAGSRAKVVEPRRASVSSANSAGGQQIQPPLVVAVHRPFPRVRSAPVRAIVLRGSAQWPVVVGDSRQRAAPRSQSVGAPRTDGLACFVVAVHAAREGGNVSVANVGASVGACAA